MIASVLKVYSIAKKYGSNFLANILQQGLRFLILYAAARQLGPEEFGVVSLLLLVANYLMNANFGAVNGLKRQIPLVYSVEGKECSITAFFAVLNFNWVSTLVLASITTIVLFNGFGLSLGASLILIPLSFSMNTYFSVQTYYTSTGNWKQLFRLQLSCAVLLFVALISLLWSSDLVLIAFYTASFLLASFFFFIQQGYSFTLNRGVIKDNLRTGFPVMLSGFIYLLFQTTDRLLVSHFYTTSEFGLYSFGWVLVMSLNLLVNLSSEMLLQRSATYFSKNEDRKKLFQYITRYSALFLGVLVSLSFILLLLINYVVPFYFSAYEGAIPVINNLVLAYVIQQTGMGTANYYYIIGKQSIYNVMLIISCILNAAILGYAIYFGPELPTLAQISSLYIWSSCIYVVLLHLPMVKKSVR